MRLRTICGLRWYEWPGLDDPVVMLHGIGSRGDGFQPVARALGVRTLAWDMPGYGGSADLEVDWPDAGDYAWLTLRCLDAAGLNRFRLLGHSLGSLVAARLALIAPDRIGHLVLSAPSLGHRTPKGQLSADAEERLADFDALGSEGMADKRAPRLLAEPSGDALYLVRRQMAALRPHGFRRAVRFLSHADMLSDVPLLSVPTDVVVGGEDRIAPPENAARVYASIPPAWRGRHVVVPGTGHAIASERPDVLAGLFSLREPVPPSAGGV